ncbi:helix-turn-helix transcriptional regulator [Pedobacter hiemivivus]|uniref:LuxR family transcriptional regulator n=1 Tax=Pedobacter hiemivivus TaxID=2530454 RepID=A0A4R0NDP5_9SPHI|nr:helix-turn-helix transcriptional regulator [Pedobacter hiemivivus]TCC97827.1 LuxR family transcriptional regulator [Pedobacter hiemivivus]
MTADSIQTKVDNAIAEMASIADRMPGVVILHDLRDWSVAWMSDRGLRQLNISLEGITNLTAEEYYGNYFNSEDAKDYVPKILGLVERNNDEEFCTCFQQVRLSTHADWVWHMASTKVFLRDDENNPLLAITLAFPIDAMHHMTAKATRLLEENDFLRKNLQRFSGLSEREREVLRLMALGKSSVDTAEKLFISQNTVETHRKNIRQKLETTSYYELCEYARAFDLI